MDNSLVTVAGFSFDNPKYGQEALKEQEAVEYVRGQIDLNDAKAVLAVYTQMINREMFHTMVGYSFLKELQGILMGANEIDPGDVVAIPINDSFDYVYNNESNEDTSAKRNTEKEDIIYKKKAKKLESRMLKYRRRAMSFAIIIAVLVVTIVAMFVITITSDNMTILNYKEKITDEYSSWEQELTERERKVSIRENELTIKENKIKENDTQKTQSDDNL